MVSGAELQGVDELLKNLESKLGETRVNRIVNKALKEIGAEAAQDLQAAGQKFVDPDMIASSRVSRVDGVPAVKVGWVGGRWRVVHLNEFGFHHKSGKFVRQGAYGVMRAYVVKQEASYPSKLRDKLGELTK